MDKNEAGDLAKQKLLFVDDSSERIHSALLKYSDFDCRIAPNVLEALRLICHEDWDVVSLDHDLGGRDFQDPMDETSGMTIVRYLVEYGWPHRQSRPTFIVHSSNAFMGNLMVDELRDAGFKAAYFPYNYDVLTIEWAAGD